MEFESRLKSYQDLVNERLLLLLPEVTEAPELLHEAMRYACLSPGKRLRPVICMAAAHVFEPENQSALNGACALEMVHSFSLIHDDLPAIDNDDLRRGLPTVHKVFGEALAILAGDALFAMAFQTLGRFPDPAIAAACVIDLAEASGTRGLVGGEVMDVLAEGTEAPAEHVAEMHRRKTAALLACSSANGARMGQARESEIEALRQFGYCLGMAFQVTDDILNLEASSAQLGKAVGSDEGRGKSTFPRAVGVQPAKDYALKMVAKASDCLDELPGDTSFLCELAQYAVHRDR